MPAVMLIPFLKLLFLAAVSPIWFPIVRELYREIEAALIEEGGLLGRTPTPDELKLLREKYKDYENPLVSEPWAEARQREQEERAGGNAAAKRKGPPRPGAKIRQQTPKTRSGGGFSSR